MDNATAQQSYDPVIWEVKDYADPGLIQAAIVAAVNGHPRMIEILTRTPAPLVVVKPNWVQESHEYEHEVWEPVITHPSVLLATVQILADLMIHGGTIAVCDGPHTYASFDAITARGGFRTSFNELRARYPHLSLELIDLRREVWFRKEEVVVERRPNPPDPRGYARLDLGVDSLFHGSSGESRFYGADYDTCVVNEHHCGAVQEYLLAGTPIACDLFVNVPKLKTHKKTGVTCCLKNLVGINGDKNWLPHHTQGSPRHGGDEFPSAGIAQRLEQTIKAAGFKFMKNFPGVGSWAYRKLRNTGKSVLGDSEQTIRNGNWQGNDTCWRMALDLNRALLYGNPDGSWREAFAPKNYFAIVDGIVGGEGSGPLCPTRVASGVIITGSDPAAVDATACRLMGFNPQELPIVREAFQPHRWPISRGSLSELQIHDRRRGCQIALADVEPAIPGGFKPHFGWLQLNPNYGRRQILA